MTSALLYFRPHSLLDLLKGELLLSADEGLVLILCLVSYQRIYAWVLADCIMSNKPVKRIMYKGGKRGISYLETEWNSKDASDNVGLVQDNVNEYTASIDNNVNENIAVDQPQNNTTSLPATMRIEPELHILTSIWCPKLKGYDRLYQISD